LQWDPEEGRHVTYSIAPRDDPYPGSRQPQKMTAVLGYALIDVMIKSDPEAQRLLTMVESPLERVWLSVWYPMRDRDVVVEPQKQVGPYRVDFLIEDQLVVELDGYLYHRASRDQLIKDYKRGRNFAARGYTVMRFSGYEVWDDLGNALPKLTPTSKTWKKLGLLCHPPLVPQWEERCEIGSANSKPSKTLPSLGDRSRDRAGQPIPSEPPVPSSSPPEAGCGSDPKPLAVRLSAGRGGNIDASKTTRGALHLGGPTHSHARAFPPLDR
jgi:very-short-patch-repair endonuclease